ncbi:MAG: hypothetical protein RXP77_02710 [Nitrososphaeria archaeon]
MAQYHASRGLAAPRARAVPSAALRRPRLAMILRTSPLLGAHPALRVAASMRGSSRITM